MYLLKQISSSIDTSNVFKAFQNYIFWKQERFFKVNTQKYIPGTLQILLEELKGIPFLSMLWT